MSTDESRNEKKMYIKAIVRGIFALLMIIVVILILAGRIDYWQGWIFGIFSVATVLIQSILFAGKTDLAKERLKPGPGTKWWDKIFWALYVPTYFAIIVVASLDAGRFQWSVQFPLLVYVISYIFHVFSHFMNLWSMWTNRFFSSTVRIQMDRGQEVVQDGPYRFVRHPGYVGGILMGTTTSLVLGSVWGLIPAAFMVVQLVVRTYLEDTTLQKELPGYTDYAKKVRHRLIPGVW